MKDLSRTPKCVLYVCCGSKCKSKGGKHLYKKLRSDVKDLHLKKTIEVIKTGCTDRCKHGPVIAAMPINQWHLRCDEHAAESILKDVIEHSRDARNAPATGETV